MLKSLLTLSEVADIFGVKPSTVARWVRDGRIAALTTPGGQYRIRSEDLEKVTGPSSDEVVA